MVSSALILVGDYGDVFWDLDPAVFYMAGGEIPCQIYVANVTDTDREYMLLATVSRDGTVISEFVVTVDGKAWFPVEAESVVSIPASMVVNYTDVVLTLNLYERDTNSVTDSVSAALYSTTGGFLPPFPGVPPSAGFDMYSMMMLMVVVMMMTMAMKQIGKEEKA